MQRWEFDSIAQAASYISSWFSGTLSEQFQLKEYLDSAAGIFLALPNIFMILYAYRLLKDRKDEYIKLVT